MVIALADLIAPLQAEEFVSRYWTRDAFVGCLNHAVAVEVMQSFAGADVRDFLSDTNATRCILWFETPNGSRECVVPIKDAYSFYEAGATLFFNLDNEFSNSINTRLRRDLGLPPSEPGKSGSVPSVFASRAGHGSKLHFDRFEIFSLQLKGRKDWWIAEPALKNVDENFCVGDEQWAKFDAYRIDAVQPPVQSSMRRLTLEPGSVLYLPRGHWHKTLADAAGDSIALNFAFGPPTLRDVLLPLIDHVANHDDHWREWFGLRTEQGQSMACRKLLHGLSQQLARLGDDLYPQPYGSHVTRNALVTLGLTGEQEGNQFVATLKRHGTTTIATRTLVSAAVVDRLRDYLGAPQGESRPVDDLDEADRWLLELGFLRPCGPADLRPQRE